MIEINIIEVINYNSYLNGSVRGGIAYVELLNVGDHYLLNLKIILLDSKTSFNRCLKRRYDT